MEYSDFIQGINAGIIKRVNFSILGYPHYKNCEIESRIDSPKENVCFRVILVKLTNDSSEQVGFYKKFNEKYKLFKLKGKGGSFTLKQIWERVCISKIETE